MKKQLLSAAAALLLCIGILPAEAAAKNYDDLEGHWARAAIQRWTDYEVIQGYGTSFSPNRSLTRGHMVVILANMLHLEKESVQPFTDVPAEAWNAQAARRCHAAGILLGNGGKANLSAPLERQQAMAMLARALGIQPESPEKLENFQDAGQVADYAAPYVAAMTRRGIVNGKTADTIAPRGAMSRAAMMTVLDRSIVQYIPEPGTYQLDGRAGIVLVATGDVTLTGTTAADVRITSAAAGKTVSFEAATVSGRVSVQDEEVQLKVDENSTLANQQELTEAIVQDPRPEKETSPSGGGGHRHSRPSDPPVTPEEPEIGNPTPPAPPPEDPEPPQKEEHEFTEEDMLELPAIPLR